MPRTSARARTAIAAVGAAMVLYLVLGHGQHAGRTMDEAAVGSGICIVLVVAVAAVALRRPRIETPLAPLCTPARSIPRPAHGLPPRARASPEWLQRFLN